MNAFGLRKSNTSATKDTETRDYKEFANKICEDIADIFYPLRGKIVSGFGNFWTCRTSMNERDIIVSIVEREENKSSFNLKTLKYELDNFIKVHGKN